MSNKKYYSCYWLNSGLHFNRNQVRFCCYEYLHSNGENVIFSDYRGEKLNLDKYLIMKNQYKEMAKSGNFHPNCKNCIYLQEREWEDDDYIDHFIFNHWLNCNSKCIYCGQVYLPKNERRQYYDIYPILKDLKNNNYLKATNDSCVVFGGGEPVLLKEFEKVMKFFLSENFTNIRVNSSGIKYSPALADALSMGAADIVISPDSGSREMYMKIKRVNAFDLVWKNLSYYSKKAKFPSSVKAKYILIPGINDIKTEIDNFFNLVLKNEIKAVCLSVEQHWYDKFYPDFPKTAYLLIDYFKQSAQKYNLEIELYCEALSVVEKGKSNI